MRPLHPLRPFGIPAASVDGSDVDAVAAFTAQSVAKTRAGQGPCFLELQCARLATHSNLTREERAAVELDRMNERDPLLLYERRLRSAGILDDALWARMRSEVDAEIAAAGSIRHALVARCREGAARCLKLFFREALARAIGEEMEREPRLFLLGQDIAQHGGSYAETRDYSSASGRPECAILRWPKR